MNVSPSPTSPTAVLCPLPGQRSASRSVRILLWLAVCAGCLIPAAARAINRMGDANQDHGVDVADTAAILGYWLNSSGVGSPGLMGPLADADLNQAIGLSDALLVGQTANALRILYPGAGMLTTSAGTPVFAGTHGGPNVIVSDTVTAAGAYAGIAENIDNLIGWYVMEPVGAQSVVLTMWSSVQVGTISAEIEPLNDTLTDVVLQPRWVLEIYDSDGVTFVSYEDTVELTVAPHCGDGAVNFGEDCDASAGSPCCEADCTYTTAGLDPDGDCSDGVNCTDDACDGAGGCSYTPNDGNCTDNGFYCDGTEYCDAVSGCTSTGNPCTAPEVCDEDGDACITADCDGANLNYPCTSPAECGGYAQCADLGDCTYVECTGLGPPEEVIASSDDQFTVFSSTGWTLNDATYTGYNATGKAMSPDALDPLSVEIVTQTPGPATFEVWIASAQVRGGGGGQTDTTLTVTLDATALTSVSHLAAEEEIYRWTNVGTIDLAAGSHTLDLVCTNTTGRSRCGVDGVVLSNVVGVDPTVDAGFLPYTTADFNSDSSYLPYTGSGLCSNVEPEPALTACAADAVACTDDVCDGAGTCVHPPNDTSCQDGDACNGYETCDAVAGCEAAAPLNCDDGIGCTVDTCDTLLGCVNTPDDLLCDDGDPCTSNVCDGVLDCTYPCAPANCGDGYFCSCIETCDYSAGAPPDDGCPSGPDACAADCSGCGTAVLDCVDCHDIVRGSRRPVVGVNGDYSKLNPMIVKPMTGYDCVVCHMEGTAEAYQQSPWHANGAVDLRDPDTGLAIAPYTDTDDPATVDASPITELCISCHDADGYTSTHLSDIVTSEGAGRTALDPFNLGLQPLDVNTLFDPTNYATHTIRVRSDGTSGQKYAVDTDSLLPDETTVVTGIFLNGKSWTATNDCADCHLPSGTTDGIAYTNNAHASHNTQWLLDDKNGEDVTILGAANGSSATITCFKCHNPQTYGFDGSQLGLSRYPEHDREQMMRDDRNVFNIACLSCHGGWTAGGIHGTIEIKTDDNGAGSFETYRFTNGAALDYWTVTTSTGERTCSSNTGTPTGNNLTCQEHTTMTYTLQVY